MAINEYKTRTGIEFAAEGILQAIYFNEIPEDQRKDYGTNGKSWIPTNRVNIVVDDVRIGLGLTDKDVLRVKDVDENYHDLVKGQKVSVVIEENGEYKGVKQWKGYASNVIILENVTQEAQQGASKGGYTASKKDMSCIASGHAINCAIGLLAGDAADDSDAVIELAKKFHDLTSKLKKEYAEKYPDTPEYDIGARVGQGVLSATQIVADFEDVEEVARTTIDTISVAVLEYVKSTQEEKKPAVVKKTAAKKVAAKKTTSKKEATPDRVDDSDIPDGAYTTNLADMDDDVPF